MAKKSEEGSSVTRNPAADLTDDLIIEILSRLPAKLVCRCKCVSRRWRGLISDPNHRKKLPQTLAGFFYHSENESHFPMEARHFINVSGRGRSLVYLSFPFLPRFERIRMVDSCGGLLLCRCFQSSDAFLYVVCNPATEEWVALPESSYDAEDGGEEEMCARLGFDPDVSSQFHVFQFVMDAWCSVVGVKIYSSEVGEWNYKGSEWRHDISVYDN